MNHLYLYGALVMQTSKLPIHISYLPGRYSKYDVFQLLSVYELVLIKLNNLSSWQGNICVSLSVSCAELHSTCSLPNPNLTLSIH